MQRLLRPGSFFGVTTSSRHVGGVTLTEGRYQPAARIPAHAHSSPYICLVLGGSYEESAAGRTESCIAGTVVYHPAQEEHADSMGAAGARCFNLELDESLSHRLEQEEKLPRMRSALRPGRATALAVSLRLRRKSQGTLTKLVVEETLLELLAELWRWDAPGGNHARRPAWLDRAVERLRQSSPPGITELAADAGVHPVYFTRVFRAVFRIPPSRYAIEARLERASALLVGSEATLSTIAQEAGYSDHSHFCRHFRRRFGMTPSDYRSELGGTTEAPAPSSTRW